MDVQLWMRRVARAGCWPAAGVALTWLATGALDPATALLGVVLGGVAAGMLAAWATLRPRLGALTAAVAVAAAWGVLLTVWFATLGRCGGEGQCEAGTLASVAFDGMLTSLIVLGGLWAGRWVWLRAVAAWRTGRDVSERVVVGAQAGATTTAARWEGRRILFDSPWWRDRAVYTGVAGAVVAAVAGYLLGADGRDVVAAACGGFLVTGAAPAVLRQVRRDAEARRAEARAAQQRRTKKRRR